MSLGKWILWPCKETQMCFSLVMLTKIELLWRCYAITASDWGADNSTSLRDKEYYSSWNMEFDKGLIENCQHFGYCQSACQHLLSSTTREDKVLSQVDLFYHLHVLYLPAKKTTKTNFDRFLTESFASIWQLQLKNTEDKGKGFNLLVTTFICFLLDGKRASDKETRGP